MEAHDSDAIDASAHVETRTKRKYTKRGDTASNNNTTPSSGKRARATGMTDTGDTSIAGIEMKHCADDDEQPQQKNIDLPTLPDSSSMVDAAVDARASPTPNETLAAANLRKKRGRKSKREIQLEDNQRKLVSLSSHVHMLQLMNATALMGLCGIFLRHPLQFELEARLGIYHSGRKHFQGGVSRQYFTALLELVRAFNDWDVTESPDGWVHSRDIYHRNGVRRIKQLDSAEKNVIKTIYQTKERFADIDFVHIPLDVSGHAHTDTNPPDDGTIGVSSHPTSLYDLRVSLRREMELPENHPVVQDLANHPVEHVRKKARRSYGNRKRGIRIDFSIVWEGTSEERVCNSATKGPETYEIELECLPPLNNVEGQAESLTLCKQFFAQATALLGTDQPVFMMPVGV